MMFRRAAFLVVVLLAVSYPARANDHATFGPGWEAEAKYGGYHRAGIHAKHGLDATIQQGGLQANHTQLLRAEQVDFNICSKSFLAPSFVKEKLSFRTAAAMQEEGEAPSSSSVIPTPTSTSSSIPASSSYSTSPSC
jgi:hypothetical protein